MSVYYTRVYPCVYVCIGLCVPMCVCVQTSYLCVSIAYHVYVCMYGLGVCSLYYCGRECYAGMVCVPQRKSLSTQRTHKPGALRTSARLCGIVYRIYIIQDMYHISYIRYHISNIKYHICMCYKCMYCVSLRGCARDSSASLRPCLRACSRRTFSIKK